MDLDRLKSRIIGSPAERPLVVARHALDRARAWAYPDRRELLLEAHRIDRALRRLVGRRSNCVDVGCHLGSVLSTLTRLAPDGRHLAFEPIPHKAEWLRERFPLVSIYSIALGETRGRVPFSENLSRSGFSGLRRTGDYTDAYFEYLVTCERLDAFMDETRPISLVKVDAEGAELSVLRGAVELLKRDRPALLVESVPGLIDAYGASRRDLFDFLSGLGYGVYLARDYLEGRPCLDWDGFDQSHVYPFQAMNYLALPARV